ncbi:hypothetical protein CVU37_06095 [candidate division BRC1 bacterium HGW-BRC1-1]|jgi:LmbE family N-acetylglucosaminyl deacetylase|nr:MAG: hypothetical protein CVU37_06095 [candidate division BRC1 bacterium HGW-BRC1-1]
MDTLDFAGRRVMAFVPHQDDEVIGMGGHIAHAARTAADLRVVLVTDGAACGGVNRMLGGWDCRPMAALDPDADPALTAEHDAQLVARDDGSGKMRHAHVLPFDLCDAPDRATNSFSAAWGKQRDAEFLAVLETLGVPREQVSLAYWDPASPEHIKDGQTSVDGASLTPEAAAERYGRVAQHYFAQFQPEIVLTMGPYEFAEPPNDHWSCAHGVHQAAAGCPTVQRVQYHHSGVHYRHIAAGGQVLGQEVRLTDDLWAIKQAALRTYLRWSPAQGWFATAAHSVPDTFAALLAQQGGRMEHVSEGPVTGLEK